MSFPGLLQPREFDYVPKGFYPRKRRGRFCKAEPGRDAPSSFRILQRLTEFFQREHIAFVDLLPAFRRYAYCSGSSTAHAEGDLYWAHDRHPNVRGNRLAGFLINRQVLEGTFVKIDDQSARLSGIDQLLNAEGRCRFSGDSQ